MQVLFLPARTEADPSPFRGLTLSVAGWMALLLRLVGPRHDPWSGAPRGQHIGYCRKPDFAVMYADGQCAHYKTNSCKGLQVLRPDLPYTHFLSLSLSFSPSVNGEVERGAITEVPLFAQIEGSTRWPRGIRKLAKPDLLVSFTCLTRARTILVPSSHFSSFIFLWVRIERRSTASKGWVRLPPVYTPTCVHICIRTIRLTVVIRLLYACATDNLLFEWELDIAYISGVIKACMNLH